MNTDEPSEPSPFAAFAMPRRNAVEEFRERQRRAAENNRRMLGSVLAGLVGATGGATTCAAFDAPFEVVLTSLVGALVGSFGGAIFGIVLGSMSFGVLQMYGNRGSRSIGSELARHDPIAAMRGLVFAWALIGIGLGASEGARRGARWAGAVFAPQSLIEWTMVGSLIGGGFALAMWFFTLRSIAKSQSLTRDSDGP